MSSSSSSNRSSPITIPVPLSDFLKLVHVVTGLAHDRRRRILNAIRGAASHGSQMNASDFENDFRRLCRPVMLAVAGTAGSGKTTLAKALSEVLSRGLAPNQKDQDPASLVDDPVSFSESTLPINSVCVPLDGYHKYRSELSAMADPETAFKRRGAPFTFSPVKYLADLKTLTHSGVVSFPAFEHEKKDPDEGAIPVNCVYNWVRMKDADITSLLFTEVTEVVVVEGIYTLFNGTQPDGSPVPPVTSIDEVHAWASAATGPSSGEREHFYDLRVFIECPLEVSTERLTQRHMKAWGISREEAFERASGSDFDNGGIILGTRAQADVVLGFSDHLLTAKVLPPS